MRYRCYFMSERGLKSSSARVYAERVRPFVSEGPVDAERAGEHERSTAVDRDEAVPVRDLRIVQ